MKQRIEVITPERAERYVQAVDPAFQRRIMPAVVEKYAAEMRCGKWATSHQGIAFDTMGRLIDGMHRMYAVIESGASIEIPVTRNVPVESSGVRVLDVLDKGKMRSVAQELQMRYNVTNATTVTALCRTILLILSPGKTFPNTTVSVLEVMEEYKSEIKFCIENTLPIARLKMGAVLGSFVFAMGYEPKAKEMQAMYMATMTGENIRRGDPAYALRQFMLLRKGVGSNGSLSHLRIVCATTLASMHKIQDNKLEVIKYSDQGLEFFKSKQKDRMYRLSKKIGLIK